MVYSHLERFRALVSDGELLNNHTDEEIENNPLFSSRISKLLDTLNSLGYSMNKQGRVPLEFVGLNEVVKVLESEHKEIIEQGRDAAKTGM